MGKYIDFNNLTFDRFRELAASDELSRHEKVGFPNEYREGKENIIFSDVLQKLPTLNTAENMTVLEIGPGCSFLPVMLTDLCKEKKHRLLFIDSQEMLSLLPDSEFIKKVPGYFPGGVPDLFAEYSGKVDIIIAYSVIQYVFAEGNLWQFLDSSLSLMADGGEILFGDIPNISMRKRFFASKSGIECHQRYTGKDELPDVRFNQLEPGRMDDSVVLSIISRARSQGFHSWVLPQARELPMATRREDILIRKP